MLPIAGDAESLTLAFSEPPANGMGNLRLLLSQRFQIVLATPSAIHAVIKSISAWAPKPFRSCGRIGRVDLEREIVLMSRARRPTPRSRRPSRVRGSDFAGACGCGPRTFILNRMPMPFACVIEWTEFWKPCRCRPPCAICISPLCRGSRSWPAEHLRETAAA